MVMSRPMGLNLVHSCKTDVRVSQISRYERTIYTFRAYPSAGKINQ